MTHPLSCEKFRLVADVYVTGAEGGLTEKDVAIFAATAIYFGLSLSVVIDPQQVERVENYTGRPGPLAGDIAEEIRRG